VLLNKNTEGEGGNTGGGWTITGLSGGSHTLSESELPNITGEVDFRQGEDGSNIFTNTTGAFGRNTGAGASRNRLRHTGGSSAGDLLTFSIGSGSGHSHPVSQDGGWRPSYAKVITCTKD